MAIENYLNFIDGEWMASESTRGMDILNPANGKQVGRVSFSTAKEVDEAVKAAKDAFEQWRRVPAVARARVLFELKNLLEDSFEDLSEIQTVEHGKTIDESRGETRRGIENVEMAAGIPTLQMGEALPDVAAGIDVHLNREPLGPFACIAPYNFPFMIPLWFLPYAIATGNTFIVKASEFVPGAQTRLFELLEELDLPPGVVNLVHGDKETSEALLAHPDIKGISFVGSTPVARYIYQKCGETGKRVIAQGGAKNVLAVLPDAPIDQTIAAFMTSFFGNTGQRCLAGAIALLVGNDNRFNQRFTEAFVEAAAQIRLGNGLDPNTQMGPLQAEFRKNRVKGFIQKGVEEGANLVLDGRDKTPDQPGLSPDCFLGPSVFTDVRPDQTIAKEEIFGPVACVMTARDLESAVEMANALPYGNAACLFTSSGKAARFFEKEMFAGNIGINVGVAAPMAFFPFSGMKDSFFGVLHGQGKDAVRFYTENKVVIKRWF